MRHISNLVRPSRGAGVAAAAAVCLFAGASLVGQSGTQGE